MPTRGRDRIIRTPMSKKKPTFRPNATVMVGRTSAGDPVWKTDDGPPFTLSDDQRTVIPVKWRWPWPRRWAYRRMKAPHLTYEQVAVANEKGKALLKALRNGPLKEKDGFVYNRSNQVVMTRAMSRVVFHWMEACGIVVTRVPGRGGFTTIDLDVEATRKNGVT